LVNIFDGRERDGKGVKCEGISKEKRKQKENLGKGSFTGWLNSVKGDSSNKSRLSYIVLRVLPSEIKISLGNSKRNKGPLWILFTVQTQWLIGYV